MAEGRMEMHKSRRSKRLNPLTVNFELMDLEQ